MRNGTVLLYKSKLVRGKGIGPSPKDKQVYHAFNPVGKRVHVHTNNPWRLN